MATHSSQKIKFICEYCDTALKTVTAKLYKKTKCPKCTKVIVPNDCKPEKLEKKNNAVASTEALVYSPSLFRDLKWLLVMVILAAGLITYFQIFLNPPVEFDQKLLGPEIVIDNGHPAVKALSPPDLKAILNSYKMPESMLPAKGILPEFTPEQSRPSRYLIKQSAKSAEEFVFSKGKTKEKTLEMLPTLDLAFLHTRAPQYLETVLNQVNQWPTLTLAEALQVLELVKNQKLILGHVSSSEYVTTMTIVLDVVKKEIKELNNPIKAIQLFRLMSLMPKEIDKRGFIEKIKPILLDAFEHKNASRTDGLFLSSEESTEFSLELIKTAWQFHLDQKDLPEWLYPLAEKESCRLAYRLEPDGCLPDWSGNNQRNSLTGEIYKASVVFDRDDLRFIAYGGRRMENAYPPEQKNFHFPEIGEAIYRTNWNIYHFSNFIQNQHLGFDVDCFQVLFNVNDNLISIYAGTTMLGLFNVTLLEKKEAQFVVISDLIKLSSKEDYQEIIFSSFKEIKIKKLGTLYVNDGFTFKAYERLNYVSDWEMNKPVWECNILKDDIKIRFEFKSMWKERIVLRSSDEKF